MRVIVRLELHIEVAIKRVVVTHWDNSWNVHSMLPKYVFQKADSFLLRYDHFCDPLLRDCCKELETKENAVKRQLRAKAKKVEMRQ